MKYILLVAGRGTRLHPLTIDLPKSLFCLDKETTVIERMISSIKLWDKHAEIIVVTGFMHSKIEEIVSKFDVTTIFNPFYGVTNSIASLWFAREYLSGNTVIINGDIVLSESIVKDILCVQPNEDMVLIDTSIKINGDYNVRTNHSRVVVMSKELEEYDGEYAGITRLTVRGSELLRNKVDEMVSRGQYDQWYENALVQMIFSDDFSLGYLDIAKHEWTEVDSVNDLLYAKKIHDE